MGSRSTIRSSTRRSSPPRTHDRTDTNAGVARVADDVPDDEEVGSEPHLGDHAQFEVEPLGDFGRDLRAIARRGTLIVRCAR